MSDEDDIFVPRSGSSLGSRILGYGFLALVSFSAIGFLSVIVLHHLSGWAEASGNELAVALLSPLIPFVLLGLLVFAAVRLKGRTHD